MEEVGRRRWHKGGGTMGGRMGGVGLGVDRWRWIGEVGQREVGQGRSGMGEVVQGNEEVRWRWDRER